MTCSAALVAFPMQLNISSVGFKPLPLLNASRSANQSFTNTGPAFQSMTTSQPSDQNRVQLTLFAVDSLAKTSAPQASKQALRKAQGRVCFLSSCESFAWWDRSTSSWRTSQRSLLTDWTPFSENWPRQGLMRNGHVFRQVLWEPATSVTAGGLLPTPKASDGERGRDKAWTRPDAKSRELATTVRDRMLPTPRANSAMTVDLRTQQNRPELHPNLETVMARMLPTLTVNDSKNSTLPPSQADRDGLAGAMLRNPSVPTGTATYLNPCFVEEMMGFPVGWTA